MENEIDYDEKCNQYVFNECRNIKPKSLDIRVKYTNCNWHVGFFNADGEVYFDEIEIGSDACFASIVRNYWWNGKKGTKKKKGNYSLIKSVKELKIKEGHVKDLLDYVGGRYEAGKHWQLHELDRNMKLIIDSGLEWLEETTV